MPGGERSAEERDGSGALVEDGAKPAPDASQSTRNSLSKS
jgi:hypothetical protein